MTYAVPHDGLDRALEVLARLGFGFGAPRMVSRAVIDSFDGRLHRAGLRLEHVTGYLPQCVLRGVGPEALAFPAPRPPRSSQDVPAGPLRGRVRELLAERALVQQLAVSDREQVGVWADAVGKIVAKAVVHDLDSSRMPLMLEVVPLLGYGKAWRAVIAALDELGLPRLAGDPIDAYAKALGVDLGGYTSSPTVRLRPTMTTAWGFCTVLAYLADTIDANWQGALDRTDPEFLHDLRVAVRRSRTVLAEGKTVLPVHTIGLARQQFAELQAMTGPARDLDVYLLEWPSYVAVLGGAGAVALAPVLAEIERRTDAAHELMQERFTSSDVRRLLDDWRALLRHAIEAGVSEAAAAPAGRNAGRPLGPFVRRRMERAHRRLVHNGGLITPDSPAELLHDLRKDAKRLRYLVECFGGLLTSPARRLLLQHLKPLQETLGTFQDAEVHAQFLRSMIGQVPDAGPAAAEAVRALAAVFDERQAEARSTFAIRFGAFSERAAVRAAQSALEQLAP